MKRRARRDELTVGTGHDGAWVRCLYRHYPHGLTGGENHPFRDEEQQWHSGNFEFMSQSGVFNDPSIAMDGNASRPRWGSTMQLIRRAPLKMNELREIDIMDGWTEAQPLKPINP